MQRIDTCQILLGAYVVNPIRLCGHYFLREGKDPGTWRAANEWHCHRERLLGSPNAVIHGDGEAKMGREEETVLMLPASNLHQL